MPQSAKSLHPYYMLSALCLGSCAEARTAVTEAAVSAERQQASVLSQTLRICQTRANDKAVPPEQCDFPPDSPLRGALKLTFRGRRDLGILLSAFSQKDAADALEITQEELSHRTEKALRQYTFLNGGVSADQDSLRSALTALPWTEEEITAIETGFIAANAQKKAAETPSVPEITKTITPKKKKTASVPLWAFLTMTGIVLLLIAALIFLVFSRRSPEPPPAIEKEAADKAIAHEYLSLDDAQNAAIAALPAEAVNPVCTNTKLKLDMKPAIYDITILCDRGVQYQVILDGKTGTVSSCTDQQTTNIIRLDGWLNTETMRAQALKQANLTDAVFLKEKRGTDSNRGYYKYEMLGADNRIYEVTMDAVTAKLLKYSVEETITDKNVNVIAPAQAQRQALARVSDLSMNQVIFTKIKLDGSVYMVGFTLNDGTQYTVEINAVTGASNAMDVRPVSADTSGMIGMLRARDIALERANLLGYGGVRMTKAKIDRENAAYVYELEFETDEYAYEVTLHTETGEILKYRATIIKE